MRLSHSSSRLLRAYCAYAFLFDFMLCYAVYTALFELKGLSTTQIAALIAFWSATAVLLEVPSGALSDRFDRRWLLFAAPLAKLFTFVCWGIADGNFWLYGLGFLFWSIGSALYSGTGEALLYERLMPTAMRVTSTSRSAALPPLNRWALAQQHCLAGLLPQAT